MTSINKKTSFNKLKEILSGSHLFSNLDIHFACFIAGLSQTDGPAVPLAAALVSCKTAEGNICVNLNEYSEKTIPIDSNEENRTPIVYPNFSEWTEQLLKSETVGQDEGVTPLVLDRSGRLYLRRYWEYEKNIISFIGERTNTTIPDINYHRLASDLQKLFKPPSPGKNDWQKIAAIMAATRFFTVVSGGPGTGKTSTVAKMLVLLSGQFEEKGKLRILLGAPTGKAASRLQEAISSIPLLHERIEIPQATTVHRMLGTIPHSPYFRHDAENPLEADIIIIDEASMVDLPLMAKLLQAIPQSARLVLLGDRHQLASVQPGSVLGDICQTNDMNCFTETFRLQISEITEGIDPAPTECNETVSSPGLQNSIVELVDNYRFSDKGGIAELSRAVKEGDSDTAMDCLLSKKTAQVSWSEIPSPVELERKLRDWDGFSQYISLQHSRNPDQCFAVLGRNRILCALRRGPYGMEKINTILKHRLTTQKSSHPGDNFQRYEHGETFLAGQPIMITKNDYSLQLFNGDVGIILPDPGRKGKLRVFFNEESGNMRDIGLDLLPAHETVFAMTVHKSQGSEFDRVLLILPDIDTPLLTRELLYTAITRAKGGIEIWGKRELFCRAVERQVIRTSGLANALWNTEL